MIRNNWPAQNQNRAKLSRRHQASIRLFGQTKSAPDDFLFCVKSKNIFTISELEI
ncbi:hypothetical protein AT05_08970 [Schleiferia thermophila str. Yellowstone]|nr:hypothetical protein AT05_08970 [Schleiferia thermophila str. Yellowstone]